MTRTDFEHGRISCLGVSNRFERRFPSQGLEILGEIVDCDDERQNVRFEALDIAVLEQLDGRVLHGALSSLAAERFLDRRCGCSGEHFEWFHLQTFLRLPRRSAAKNN